MLFALGIEHAIFFGVLAGLLIGAVIWGVVGMILIIPTIAILKKLFEMSPETEPYAYLFGEEDSTWFKKRLRKREQPKPEEPV